MNRLAYHAAARYARAISKDLTRGPLTASASRH
jgi:hypothetical protein